MAARATAHVALAPPAARRLPRRVRAPPARASVMPASGAARAPASPALAAAQPRLCARAPPPGVPGGFVTGARRRRPRGSVLVGVAEADRRLSGRRAGDPAPAGDAGVRGPRRGAAAENPEAPADVFATVVTEGFGVASARAEGAAESSGSSSAEKAPNAPGSKRAWLKKTVWKALSAADAASPPDEIVATLENYPEADGGALNGGVEEELKRGSSLDEGDPLATAERDGGNETTRGVGDSTPPRDETVDLEAATRGVGSIIAASVATGSGDTADKSPAAGAAAGHAASMSGVTNGDASPATPATEKKKKKDKRYLAVNPPKPYEVMRINAPDASEAPGRHLPQRLTRRALLRDAELTPRDLRRIDPSLLQTNNTPALLVKDQTIMVNLGVRVIIRPDHALLFEPETDTGRRFLNAVDSSTRERGVSLNGSLDIGNGLGLASAAGASRLKSASSAEDAESDYDYDLNAAPGGTGGAPIPFELEMVEAALQETMSQLYAKLEFCRACRRVSSQLRSSINPAVLEELRLTKQSLVALDSRGRGAAGAAGHAGRRRRHRGLHHLLDRDERGGQGGRGGGGGEPDRVLPAADGDGAQRRRAAAGKHARPRGSISVSLSRGGEVSKLELTLSIATFAAALGALVTGIFGMNLRSCLEMSITAFYLTCFLIVTGIGAIFQSIMRFARRQKIL